MLVSKAFQQHLISFGEILKSNAIHKSWTRPGVHDGIWSMFLLPVALILSAFNNPKMLSKTYTYFPTIAFGFIFTNLLAVMKLQENRTKFYEYWLFFIMSLFNFLFFRKAILFMILSCFLSTVIYCLTFKILLKKFPKCFTIGEAGICSQAFILCLFSTVVKIITIFNKPTTKPLYVYTLIIQMELAAILLFATFVYFFKIRKGFTFYIWGIFIFSGAFLMPMNYLLGKNVILLIIYDIFYDPTTLKLVLYWIICCCISVVAINLQIKRNEKASTGSRKIFHLLAFAVYIPGLFFNCHILFLASGILLGVFVMIELMRILNIPPLGSILQDGFRVYSDEKDAGILALTPIYLLVGCSMPIWMHPGSCDITNSTYFNILPLLSGLLTIGIGDTLASFIGSKYGQHKWPGSQKTFEGTVACVVGQAVTVFLLNNFGYLYIADKLTFYRLGLSILISSCVEAKTDQVDNLVLPLIMYIFLV